MSVEIGFKDSENIFFRAEMWTDELTSLQMWLTAKESREETNFAIVNLTDGGMLTIDLSEVLFVNATPYLEDENTTIEVEYIDIDDFEF